MLLLLCNSFLLSQFYTVSFLDLLIYLPLTWLIMPSFISICIHNTNMYSYIFLPAVISICHLPDQLDESCLLRERGQKGSISWKPVLELPAIYVKSLFMHWLSWAWALTPHSHSTSEIMYSHHHLSNHPFSISYTLLEKKIEEPSALEAILVVLSSFRKR